MSRIASLIIPTLIVTLVVTSHAGPARADSPDEYKQYLNAKPDDVVWWRDAKFGMFIHWGPCTMAGTEIGWSRKGERRGVPDDGIIPTHVYDNLYKGFDPYNFNAREWAALAKEAGQNYIVFTTKHHDGFCMWDTKTTDYNITNSPFKRDIVAELAKACHEEGMKFGVYYSITDWYHPDHRTENQARYNQYMLDQLRELLTNYGRVDILWFDSVQAVPGPQLYDMYNVYKLARTLQPGILINSRGAGLNGDFSTPEGQVGRFDNVRPWESAVKMRWLWAWTPGSPVMSFIDSMHFLLCCAGGDGNLLFNVSPMPNGAIEQPQIERLKEMGAWTRQFGQSIYGTRGGPFKPSPWMVSTHRGNTVYLHILDWEGDGPIRLTPIEKKIVDSSLLTGGEVDVKQMSEGIEIRVPTQYRREIDTIVALTLDGPASELALRVPFRSGSVAAGKKITASGTREGNPGYVVDDDFETIWHGDPAKLPLTLEVDLGEPITTERALVSSDDCDFHFIKKFELEYMDGDEWRAIEGKEVGRQWKVPFNPPTVVGYKWHVKFRPIKTRFVRLVILECSGVPGVREIQLFAPNMSDER